MTRRRDDRHDGGGFGRKVLVLAAFGGLAYWAGRDPSGAAIVAHALGGWLAHLGHGQAAGGTR